MRKRLASPMAYQDLLQEIGQALHTARQQAAQAVNTLLVQTYWHIGQHIVEFEQGGKEKADYGSGLLDRLSKDLSTQYGKGFSRSNVFYMRKLYLCFQNSETLSHKLTWSHYFEILKADEPLEISFYTRQSALENWSVRELKRKKTSKATTSRSASFSALTKATSFLNTPSFPFYILVTSHFGIVLADQPSFVHPVSVFVFE